MLIRLCRQRFFCYNSHIASDSSHVWPSSISWEILKTSFTHFYGAQPKRLYSDVKTNEDLLFSNSQTTTIPSMLKVKRTIKYGGVLDSIDGFSFIQTVCPACPSTMSITDATDDDAVQKSDKKKLTRATNVSQKENIFINKTTGDVVCPKCQHIYSFSAIENFYSPPKSAKAQIDLEKTRNLFMKSKPKPILLTPNLIDKNAVTIDNLSSEQLDAICQHLGIENLTHTAFEDTQMLFNVKQKILYLPMRDADMQIVGYKKLYRLSAGKLAEETYPEANSFGVVMLPPTAKRLQKENKTAILVLNMLDVLALKMQKTNATIICLPYGFKTLPQECLPALESFQKLILWFDYNSVGWDIAKNFAKKLDEKRCNFVRPTEDNPTPYLAIQKSIAVKTILASAQPILHKAITTFRSLRQDVLSDLQNIDKVQGIKWKRYPILNKFLKGHRRGELTILTGPTGSGKTTFMSEYSLDLAVQGVNTLWGSFEIRNTRLATTLLQQMARKPLDENIEEFDHWANIFEQLPMYFMTFHGQQALKIVMENVLNLLRKLVERNNSQNNSFNNTQKAIEHAQYVHDIHHVIIDNLQFMMGTTDEARHIDRYWKQDEIISAFRTFATRKNCHVTLVIHPRKERNDEDLTTNSIFGSAKATQEADNVLIIQDKRLVSVKGKKYLQIAKNRYSGDLGIMILDFDKDALSYAPKKDKIQKKD